MRPQAQWLSKTRGFPVRFLLDEVFYADKTTILVQFEGTIMHPLILVALMLGLPVLLVSI